MVRPAFTAAVADVWAAITAIQFYYYFLNLQPGAAGTGTTTTSTASAAQASATAGEFQLFLTLVAAGALYAAVALIYRHLHHAEVAAAGNRRVPGRVAFALLAAAGLLEFLLLVQGVPSAVDDDVVGVLGVAALRALPGAATATFFLGMMTIIFAARVRSGAGAGFFGEIQGPVRVLTKIAVGAAAGLVFLVTVAAFCIK